MVSTRRLRGPARYKTVRALKHANDHQVLVAIDTRTDARVVLKLISSDAPERMRWRFREEQLLRSEIDHAGITPVLDFGQTPSGVLYAVSPYVATTNPRRYVNADRLKRFPRFAERLIEAVGFLHESGHVHGDIKPANILFEARKDEIRALQLTDFMPPLYGRNQGFGLVAGTISYLAPEAIRGEPSDHRTDLYALGVTLYEVLFGKVPFLGEGAEIAKMHLRQEVEFPKSGGKAIPDGWLDALRALLQKNPADRPQSAFELLPALTGRAGAEKGVMVVPAAPFVGRRAIREKFDNWLRRDEQACFFITGEEGVGKTRLLRNLTGQLKLSETPVFHLSVPSRIDRTPFEGVRLILGEVSGSAVPIDKVRRRPGRRAERSGSLDKRSGGVALFRDLEKTWKKAVLEATADSARQPLLVIDDFHRLDRSTKDFLQFLVHRDEPQPARILATALHGSDGTMELLEKLEKSGGAAVLSLGRFDEEEVAEYLHGVYGRDRIDPSILAAASRISGNHPGRLGALVRQWTESGSVVKRYGRLYLRDGAVSVRLATGARPLAVEDLPPAASLLCAAVGLAPVSRPDHVIRRIASISEEQWTEYLPVLIARRLIRIEPTADADLISPCDESIREGLAEAVPEKKRIEIHKLSARIADEEARQGREGAKRIAAHHYEQAGTLGKAKKRYLEAAAELERVFADREAGAIYGAVLRKYAGSLSPREVAEYSYRRAALRNRAGDPEEALRVLGSLPRPFSREEDSVLLWRVRGEALRAWILWNRGEAPEADRIYARLLELRRRLPAREVAALMRDHAWVIMFMGRHDESRSMLEESLELVKRRRDPLLRGQILNRLGSVGIVTGNYGLARKRLRESIDLLKKYMPWEAGSPLANLALVTISTGRLQDAALLLEEAMASAGEAGDVLEENRIIEDLARVRWRLGEWDAAERLFTRAEQGYRDYGEESRSMRVYLGLANMALTRGRLDNGIRHARRAVREARVEGNPSDVVGGLAVLVEAYLLREEGKKAGEVLDEFRNVLESAESADSLRVHYTICLGQFALFEKRWEDALACFDEAESVFRKRDHAYYRIDMIFYALQVALELDDQDRVREGLKQLEKLIGREPNPFNAGKLDLFRGRYEERWGDHASAIDSFRNATRVFGALDTWIYRADALARLGHAYLRQGDRRKARRNLGDASRFYNLARYVTPPPFLMSDLGELSPESDGMGEPFRLICRISEAVNTMYDIDGILEYIIDEAIQYLGADRGFILLQGKGDRPERMVARSIEGGFLDDRTRFSKTLLRKSQSSPVPIVYANVRSAEGIESSESMETYNILSVIAAPLFIRGEPIGLIYLDHCEREGIFSDSDTLFLTEVANQTAMAIQNARLMVQLKNEKAELQQEIRNRPGKEEFIGSSPAILRVRERALQGAASDIPVLLLGDTGTGKNLVAKLIHDSSNRSSGEFVNHALNAIPPTMVESALFGHEEGAFTDAKRQVRGVFEAAHRGTLFLDEIGDVPMQTQAKLLRVLQEGEFERLGGTETIRVDVRIVAATNKDIRALVAEGRFREDLFFRLENLIIEVPPLRERREDIEPLAKYFLRRLREMNNKSISAISPAALQCLLAFDWPGNVRELQHAIEHAVVFCEGNRIEPEHLPPKVTGDLRLPWGEKPDTGGKGLFEGVENFEKGLIRDALERTGWNMSRAARELQCHEATVRKKMKKYGISRRLPDSTD